MRSVESDATSIDHGYQSDTLESFESSHEIAKSLHTVWDYYDWQVKFLD